MAVKNFADAFKATAKAMNLYERESLMQALEKHLETAKPKDARYIQGLMQALRAAWGDNSE